MQKVLSNAHETRIDYVLTMSAGGPSIANGLDYFSARRMCLRWMRGSCTDRQRLLLPNGPSRNGPPSRLQPRMKRAVGTKALMLRLDHGPDSDKLMNPKCSARGKARFLNIPSGRHPVEIVDCGVKGNVDCP